MVSEIGEPDLFIGSKTHLYNMFDLFAGDLFNKNTTPGTLLMT